MNFTAKDKKGKSSTCYLQCPGAAVGSLKVGGKSQKSQGRHVGNAALQPVFQVSQQSSPRCLVSEVLLMFVRTTPAPVVHSGTGGPHGFLSLPSYFFQMDFLEELPWILLAL